MPEENFKLIDINGVKVRFYLRASNVINQYKVGDDIKVMISDYGDSFNSYVGSIIGLTTYENHPTVVIAYLKTDYAKTAEMKVLCYNILTKDIELCPLDKWDVPLKKSDVLNYFRSEQEKKNNVDIAIK